MIQSIPQIHITLFVRQRCDLIILITDIWCTISVSCISKVFSGTALHEVWKSGVLDRSRTPVVNYRYIIS